MTTGLEQVGSLGINSINMPTSVSLLENYSSLRDRGVVFNADRVPVLGIKEKRRFYLRDAFEKITGKTLRTNYMGIISFGKCNFNCVYCKRGGHRKDVFDRLRIDGARDMALSTLSAKVLLLARQGHIVRFSGGEPSMFLDIVEQLSVLVKSLFPDAVTSMATNGSLKRIVGTEFIDIYAVDVKAPPEKIEGITGIPAKISYHKVVENIGLLVKNGAKFIEVRTPIFKDTTIQDLETVYRDIPKQDNVWWTWRPYYPVKGVTELEPPSKKQVTILRQEFLRKQPDAKIYVRRKGW